MKKLAAVSIALLSSSHIHAATLESNHQNEEFKFKKSELNTLNVSSLSILDDYHFVLNNELALLDWDSFFASYAPSLKDQQDIIMNFAGYSSINPKLLIALMEMNSQIVSNPTAESYQRPFGDLSNLVGFKEQVKDVTNQLNKRFYAFRKLELNIDKSDNSLNEMKTPTSASTVALNSLLQSRKSTAHLSTETHQKLARKSNNLRSDSKTEHTLYDVLTTYENLFSVTSQELMRSGNVIDQSRLIEPNKQKKQSKAAAFSLRAPWASGWSWRASGGAHASDGSGWPYSSLDFYYGYGNTGWGSDTPWVQASHSGYVTRFSSCNTRIIHSSGYATNYYHMSTLQHYSGNWVNMGDWIGEYANTQSQALCEGGQSSGPHLHWSLLYNGNYISLQGWSFSDIYVQVGNQNYDANCSRAYFWKNGTTYCANQDLYNGWR